MTEARIPFFLAGRQLKRGSKWTLALIILLMATAFINLVFVSALFNGIIDGSNRQTIDMQSGHIIIKPVTGQELIPDINQVLTKVRSNPAVQSASAEYELGAHIFNGQRSGSWRLLAIKPDEERQVTRIADKMISGSYLEPGDADGIIIGRQIAGGADVEMNAASLQNVEAGDKLRVVIGSMEGEFIVRGVFATKYIETDARAFMTDAGLNKLVPGAGTQANTVLIRLNKDKNESKIIDELKQSGIQGTFYTWSDLAGIMRSVTKSFISIDVLLSFVATLIAAVTIFIVVYIDVSGKRREIGILRAIGIKPYLIRMSYVILSVVYSLAGVLVGTAILFGLLMPYFRAHPFSLPIVDAVLVVNPVDFIARVQSILLTAVGVSLIPTFMITRQKLLTAIWGK